MLLTNNEWILHICTIYSASLIKVRCSVHSFSVIFEVIYEKKIHEKISKYQEKYLLIPIIFQQNCKPVMTTIHSYNCALYIQFRDIIYRDICNWNKKKSPKILMKIAVFIQIFVSLKFHCFLTTVKIENSRIREIF